MGDRLRRLRERTNGYTVTPRQCAIAAYVALGALSLIVLTGAAVRLTGSGLGCPQWPKCYGRLYPPLSTHAVIEFSNRLITGPICIAAGAAWLAALRRRPYRRDLTWIAALLPVGVIAQAVLGGLTVQGRLDYGWVMAHFALSMLILVAASALAWRAGGWALGRGGRAGVAGAEGHPRGAGAHLGGAGVHPGGAGVHPRGAGAHPGGAGVHPGGAGAHPGGAGEARVGVFVGGPAARVGAHAREGASGGEARVGSFDGDPAARADAATRADGRPPLNRRVVVLAARAVAALGALTIFAGTAATAAGPHAGGSPGQQINRMDFDGRGTMDFVIHRHAEIALVFGLAAVWLWWLARRCAADVVVRRGATALCVLIALQGAVGLDQYETHLPTELVWVHVALATATWLAALWTAYAAGRVGTPSRRADGTPTRRRAGGADAESGRDAEGAHDAVLAGR